MNSDAIVNFVRLLAAGCEGALLRFSVADELMAFALRIVKHRESA